jgi:hypothetical protein
MRAMGRGAALACDCGVYRHPRRHYGRAQYARSRPLSRLRSIIRKDKLHPIAVLMTLARWLTAILSYSQSTNPASPTSRPDPRLRSQGMAPPAVPRRRHCSAAKIERDGCGMIGGQMPTPKRHWAVKRNRESYLSPHSIAFSRSCSEHTNPLPPNCVRWQQGRLFRTLHGCPLMAGIPNRSDQFWIGVEGPVSKRHTHRTRQFAEENGVFSGSSTDGSFSIRTASPATFQI